MMVEHIIKYMIRIRAFSSCRTTCHHNRVMISIDHPHNGIPEEEILLSREEFRSEFRSANCIANTIQKMHYSGNIAWCICARILIEMSHILWDLCFHDALTSTTNNFISVQRSIVVWLLCTNQQHDEMTYLNIDRAIYALLYYWHPQNHRRMWTQISIWYSLEHSLIYSVIFVA